MLSGGGKVLRAGPAPLTLVSFGARTTGTCDTASAARVARSASVTGSAEASAPARCRWPRGGEAPNPSLQQTAAAFALP
jgi:hypothetical protein